MRLVVLSIAFLFALAGASRADVTGHWEGAITRLGSAQPISLDIHANPDGMLAGTYDIPELTLYGEPIKDLRSDGKALSVHILYGSFALAMQPGGDEMTAVNAGWNPAVDLHLKRAFATASYEARESVVPVGGVRIAGTLYLPDRRERVPLVVVVPGSDNGGRKVWELRGYAVALAQNGIAAFVYDKRGVGGSTHVARATFDQYAGDAVAIVDKLRALPGIDPSRVGLLGLSQGGWISIMAARRDPNVRFVVLGSGPSRSVEQQEMDRVEFTLRGRDATRADIDAALAYTRVMYDVAFRGADKALLAASIAGLDPKAAWADVVMGPDPGETTDGVIADLREQRYDPTADLRALRIPVLAFFGTSDTMVPPVRNVAAMEADLAHTHHRVVVIDGASHGLFTGQHLIGGDWKWPAMFWHWDRRAAIVIPSIVSLARTTRFPASP
ncbi:MAG TPA: alpha/beta fold hydrolase [Candidatus Baltobacteraceae bacterium]